MALYSDTSYRTSRLWQNHNDHHSGHDVRESDGFVCRNRVWINLKPSLVSRSKQLQRQAKNKKYVFSDVHFFSKVLYILNLF